ncbi:hypothetical protein [Telmatospirillum sp.]|uniref:hypothetical protein n=1 Tax=Telmatospirillum sp. TaxID=2079197 RepID=UPI0028410AAB|nr:hypothetical protein [Telmatospirillum sp.]MDR3439856.1 hypothetical protein [Telmatospirillum sp.]
MALSLFHPSMTTMARRVAKATAAQQAEFLATLDDALRARLGPDRADIQLGAIALELHTRDGETGASGRDLIDKLAFASAVVSGDLVEA